MIGENLDQTKTLAHQHHVFAELSLSPEISAMGIAPVSQAAVALALFIRKAGIDFAEAPIGDLGGFDHASRFAAPVEHDPALARRRGVRLVLGRAGRGLDAVHHGPFQQVGQADADLEVPGVRGVVAEQDEVVAPPVTLVGPHHRRDLVEALDRLVKEHAYTQDTLAERLGKDRTTIANSLRLLKLPASVRSRVITGELTEGHARALLGAPDERKIEDLAEKVVRGKLSVRAVEALVRQVKQKGSAGKGGKDAPTKSSAVRDLEARLTRQSQTKVLVKDHGNKGEIVIPYSDLDHLDRILARVFRIS